ncbi:MAG: hypothetical protein V4516_03995 [Pseudomonadota bacterium]
MKRPVHQRLRFLARLALLVSLASPLHAQDSSTYQVAGAVAAYLGVMPAGIVGGHPPKHPEPRMHGGPPSGVHADHIVIALFEEPTGKRIEDATVEVTISGVGGIEATRLTLEAMPIAGVVTYGGYVRFPGRDSYTIDLAITRPGNATVTRISFAYDHTSG